MNHPTNSDHCPRCSDHTHHSSRKNPRFINLPRPLYSIKALADLLDVGKSTIYNMLKDGTLPTPIKIGPRRIAFLREDIEKFIESCPKANIAVDNLNLEGGK